MASIFSSTIKRITDDEALSEEDKARITELNSNLHQYVVEFEYVLAKKVNKSDGSDAVRLAIGTKMEDFIEKFLENDLMADDAKVNGGICKPKVYRDYQTYYDLSKKGWRVFHPTNLVRIVKVYKNTNDMASIQAEAERVEEICIKQAKNLKPRPKGTKCLNNGCEDVINK